MPKNNDLQKVDLPMVQKWNQKPQTDFVNNIAALEVELISAPSQDDLLKYIPEFVGATWAETPYEEYTEEERLKALREMFIGNTLPTALETIGLVFRISGISMQEVTHILRHRGASFSADCSGDKWWTDKRALVPNSIIHSDEFFKRYQKIVRDSKQLYCDMIDSKQVSIMDARYILPRCLETFYYMRMNIKDAIAFIKQRIDKQIQPETDNVMAYLMYLEILKVYPLAAGLVDVHAPSSFYVKMARTGKATNLYFPDEDSDIFDWNENDFIYQCKRSEMNGTNEDAGNLFEVVFRTLAGQIEYLEDNARKRFPKCF